jgi:beta-galactosidase/beta-glucuronidase
MNDAAEVGERTWPAETFDLDGTWELVVGDYPIEELASIGGVDLEVPGLWEAQGHLGLDGVAWCRRRFEVADPSGWWALRFGAVMDDADVFLNGHHLGSHQGGFTPFELDCTDLLRSPANELAVRIVDHPRGSAEHGRSAHGKQGWMNEVFPSPPSLYLDYGGIWQSVSLERRGPVRVTDCWANGDPADLVVEVSLASAAEAPARVEVDCFGRQMVHEVTGDGACARFVFGPSGDAELWSPARPALHEAIVRVYVHGRVSDRRTVRFGLRTITLSSSSFELNGVPFEMRSALVQGFSARTLYGPLTRAEAEAEVAKVQSLGLNTLRLHIKAFDPVYLDVCDERGMLVHCDIPIAEPFCGRR